MPAALFLNYPMLPLFLAIAPITVFALLLAEFPGIAAAITLHVGIPSIISFAAIFMVHKTAIAFEHIAIGQGHSWRSAGKEAPALHISRGSTCIFAV